MPISIPTAAERPDWIIIGIRRKPGDGVCLYASKTLRSVRMDFEFGDSGFFSLHDSVFAEGPSSINMTAVLDSYVFVIASTYSEAIAQLGDLFGAWERDERWEPQIEVVPPVNNVRELRRPIELGTGE